MKKVLIGLLLLPALSLGAATSWCQTVPLVDMPTGMPPGYSRAERELREAIRPSFGPPAYYVRVSGYVLRYDKVLERKQYTNGFGSATIVTITERGISRTVQDCMRRGYRLPKGKFFQCVPVVG
jgi:hypothetical protein